MLGWLRNRRRSKMMQRALPSSWIQILQRGFPHYATLDTAEQGRLGALMQAFLAEKRVDGAGGFSVTEEVRVSVAANACLMILNLSLDFFNDVDTILVYPGDVLRPEPLFGDRTTHGELAYRESPLLGEAVYGGPVLLSWDAATNGAVHPDDGLNVVIHEFAHKMDMLTGEADGMPPLKTRADAARWTTICDREYRHLKRRISRGLSSFFDDYAAEHPAEFFAVVSEYFFEKPGEVRRKRPELYQLFSDFYRQDPAERR